MCKREHKTKYYKSYKKDCKTDKSKKRVYPLNSLVGFTHTHQLFKKKVGKKTLLEKLTFFLIK